MTSLSNNKKKSNLQDPFKIKGRLKFPVIFNANLSNPPLIYTKAAEVTAAATSLSAPQSINDLTSVLFSLQNKPTVDGKHQQMSWVCAKSAGGAKLTPFLFLSSSVNLLQD